MTEDRVIYDRLTKPRIVGWEHEPPTNVSPIQPRPWDSVPSFNPADPITRVSNGVSASEFYRIVNGLGTLPHPNDKSGDLEFRKFQESAHRINEEADVKERIMAAEKQRDDPLSCASFSGTLGADGNPALDVRPYAERMREWALAHSRYLSGLDNPAGPMPRPDENESVVIDRHLATERADCEHVAPFTLRDALIEPWTDETPERVRIATFVLNWIGETR